MSGSIERQLLFAILAFQNSFIDRKTLLSAFDDWSQDKRRSFDELLVEQGALTPETAALVGGLVAHHLQRNDGDAGRSLGHVAAGNPALSDHLKTVADPIVRSSLSAALDRSAERADAVVPRRSVAPSDGSENNPGPAEGDFRTVAAPRDTLRDDAVRFKILRPHAQGGLGEVFVAEDGEVPREVALKQMQSRHADDADSRARFLQEAEITGGLEHPNIVPVYGLGTYADGRPYYAMRFIRGESLQEAADRFHRGDHDSRQKRSFELRKLLDRFIDVCNAVEYAHSRGVLHRDLKPANVMLGRYGETLVVDWGLAKVVRSSDDPSKTPASVAATMQSDERPISPSSSDQAAPTQMGSALGTPQFMSPEQAAGRLDLLSPASDVYSLGATLYYVLTGKPAFDGTSVGDVLRQVQAGETTPARQANRLVDRPLESVCRRAMALRPADRYATARALADDLERWLADEPVKAHRESTWGAAARFTRKHRSWTLAGFLMLITVSLASATAAVFIQNSKVSELRAMRLASAADDFSRGLQAEEWNAAHLKHMEERLAELRSLDHPGTDGLNESLRNAVGESVERRLRATSITESDVAAVEDQLSWLESRDAGTVKTLRNSLAARLRVWQPIFAVAPPYTEIAGVFEPKTATGENGRIVFDGPNSKQGFVDSRQSAQGDVRLQVRYAEGWEKAPRVGVAFHASENQGYEFFVSPAKSEETGKDPTFADAARTEGEITLEIRRNGRTLQQYAARAAVLGEGPLRISAERVREKLSLQVNEGARLEAYDPFPLSGGSFVFAVARVPEASPSELQAFRQTAPAHPSPLEAADRRYDESDYDGAMGDYLAAAGSSVSAEVRQEAECKQALCLIAMKRSNEAIDVLRKVYAESGERWPALAGLHLWVALEREKRIVEADAAFESLSSKYRFEQLAALIPHDLREQLFDSQISQFLNLGLFAEFNPTRLKKMEQVAAIDRLLSPDGRGQERVQGNLLRGYIFAGDTTQAIPLAERLYEESGKTSSLRNYVRLLIWTGDWKRAVDAATKHLGRLQAGTDPLFRSETHLYRARALIAGERWDEAARDAAEALALGDHAPNHGPPAAAFVGRLLEREGMSVSALEIYRKSFLRHREYLKTASSENASAMILLAMGAWSGELTDEEAAARLTALIGDGGGNPVFKALAASIQSESLGQAMRSMWLTPRGRQTAEATYVFESAMMSARIRSIVQLLASEVVDRGAFGAKADEDRRALIWSIAERAYDAMTHGEWTAPQMMQLALAWKGTTNFLGWGGVAPSLPAALRADIAYVLGARAARRGDVTDAESLFRESIEHAAKDSPAAKSAADDLRLLRKRHAVLRIRRDEPGPAVRISSGGKEVRVVAGADRSDVELAPGTYNLSFSEQQDLFEASATRIRLDATDHVEVEIRPKWAPGDPQSPLAGLVPKPAKLPAVGAWQCDTLQPRGAIGAIAWSPDEKLVACTTSEQLRIYDPRPWKLVRVFRVSGIGVVDWSSLGTLAFTETKERVRIVKLDGSLDRQLAATPGMVRALAWSNDGKLLATAGSDKKVRLWGSGGSLVRTLAGHEGEVSELAWSSDDQFLLSGSADGTARIWGADGTIGPVIDGYGPDPVLAWRPGTHIACTLLKQSEIKQTTPDGRTLEPIRAPDVTMRRLAWHPNGDLLSIVSGTHIVQVNIGDGKRSTFQAATSSLLDARWSRDGQRLATACGDGRLRLWGLDFQEQASLDHISQVRAISMSSDDARLGIARIGKPMVVATDGTWIRTLEGPSVYWTDIAWHPVDGRSVAGGYSRGQIVVWNADGTPQRQIQAESDVRRLRWSPDGRRLAALTTNSKLQLWDSTLAPIGSYRMEGASLGSQPDIVWMRDSAGLWTIESGQMRRWSDDLKQSVSWTVPPTLGELRFCRPSPDGKSVLLGGTLGAKVVAASGDWTAELADRKSFLSGTSSYRGVWSPDGRRVAFGTYTGDVKLTDPASASTAATLAGQARPTHDLCISADGRFLYSGSVDGTVYKWSLNDGTVEWVAATTSDDQAAVFTPGGRVASTTPKFDEQFVYFVERGDRSWDAVSPAEFRKRIAPPAQK
jgi:serine/threonine protein kinase/WD40 repeat protein/tetratricopeptide (TPR) repeat protein